MIRGVFVKTTVRRRGDKIYTYLSLVEAVRVNGKNTHRTLLRLGEVSELADSGQLDRIIAALRVHADGEWVQAGDLEAQGAPGFGAIAAARTYFVRLGLDRYFADVKAAGHFADAVFVMVANRLVRPASKRRTIIEWLDGDVSLPDEVTPPGLQHCYRALDTIAQAKDSTEAYLYARLTELTNLDLRLVCYDLTSTYFETTAAGDQRFASKAFGYSRDHRSDRPQVMIGLLVTGDGVPIAHHVFAGNTKDATTLPAVMADLQARFGVGRIALVADRGLISETNLDSVAAAGFDHVLATRLHRDSDVTAVLEAAAGADVVWVPVAGERTACEIVCDGRRHVVVDSPARRRRDDHRRDELLARTEDKLIALAQRVRTGKLADPAKIGAAADRILHTSGVQRCFTTKITTGRFTWGYDQAALDYEQLLAGRYVLTTSLTIRQASTADVVRHYQSLANVEHRFKVLKDFLALRPVYHWTEQRVRGHIAICVLAATIEAVMANDLATANIADPDLDDQTITPRRALAELGRIRRATLTTGERTITVVTRRNNLQARIAKAFGINTNNWDKAAIT